MPIRPDSPAGTARSRRIPRRRTATVFWTLVLLTLCTLAGPGLPGLDALTTRPAATGARAGTGPEAGEGPQAGNAEEAGEGAGAGVPSPAHRDGPAGQPVYPAMPPSAPTRLTIPKIGVDAPFTGLRIGPSGALDPPPAHDTNLVGWQAGGITPGERGTALIAGHLDTSDSPAVFARLSELVPGDRFTVQRADGTTATFTVESAETFRKDSFPDQRVYADTPAALVRLITCAGPYDHTARDYTENLVVSARLDPHPST
ncbi:class F sortase [Streptomyces sp. NPDC096030]|uniref:class F sortase n=1 Tax=Streptomyces sp. NPDC096030 TaxID=3155423 RepID=UPI0033182B9A